MFARLKQIVDEGLQAIEEVEQESLLDQGLQPQRKLHLDVIGVTVLACLILTILEFHGSSSDWRWIRDVVGWFDPDAAKSVKQFFRGDKFARLHRLGYWSLMTFVGYMIVPMIWVKLVMRRSLLDMGLSPKGVLRHSWVYVLLYLVVLPAVYLVSGTKSFQATYPFYDNAGRSLYDFLAWELLYAIQFMSLEFFFRGFLVHGLKRRFGFYAIFVSVIPYCMIHFGKPMPEAIGSILAGLVLGAFSLFTGSIWLGVLIHISVAVSMDVFAL